QESLSLASKKRTGTPTQRTARHIADGGQDRKTSTTSGRVAVCFRPNVRGVSWTLLAKPTTAVKRRAQPSVCIRIFRSRFPHAHQQKSHQRHQRTNRVR